jgi:hypothetical protein
MHFLNGKPKSILNHENIINKKRQRVAKPSTGSRHDAGAPD